MLPRSRIIAVLIIGLGAAMIAAGAFLPRLVSDDPKIPLDLPDTTYALRAENGVSTKLLPDGSREDAFGPIRRQFHGQLIPPADEKKVSVRLGTSTTRELPPEVMGTDPILELVDAAVWTFTVDRLSGQFLAPAMLTDQMAGVPLQVPVDGYWVKFPAGAGKETYPVFDDFLRRTVPAEFAGTEEIGGNEVLRYRQTIAPTNLATLYRSNLSQINVDDKTGFLMYQGTREWLVEPESGMVVDINEDLDLRWETREGERLRTLLRFTGGIDDQASAKLLQQALEVADTAPVRAWSIALLTIGAILAFGGVVGALRPEGHDRSGGRERPRGPQRENARARKRGTSAGNPARRP
ncbi:DUF3068 domain-containing protein [Corynebacterium hansenii]|uniref:DUF3068 domain-containing protein n=1 Tax=Corynebacterium hansenii TaxID=394964 RepID=A0ABV7ZN57_9CORY|nr:DUF3068 domain-containing protein [Corynebacterium hansenii]WJY98976.1 hypothetical protein CHAN_01725 [Corynebacterium hansenii]